MHFTPFLTLHLALLALLAAVAIPTVRRSRRAKRAQDSLIQALGGQYLGAWFRINVCRPGFFARRFKLLAFEARGLLVVAPDHVRILAKLPSGETLDRTLARNGLDLRWLGSFGLASGNLHWFSLGHGEHQLMVTADTGFNALQSREATADLWRRIAPDLELPQSARSEFALEKHPATLGLVLLFFALLAFAAVDGVILNHNALLNRSGVGGLPLLLLVAPPVYWWLSRQRVPWRESWVLAILTSMALMLAYLPALKRLDQWLSAEGPQPYAYRLGADATLHPVVAGPPRLDFARSKEYWAQFETGSTHSFRLTHGPLGLWQLDRSELDRDMRQFYQGRRD